MRTGLSLYCLIVLVLLLSGCGMFSGESVPKAQQSISKPTLGDLYFEPLPLDHTPLEQPETITMRDAYKTLLEMVGDPDTKQIVQYRLADLEVLLAEQKQENGLPIESPLNSANQPEQNPQKLFDLAIAQYQQLLLDHPQNPDNVEVLYQLAKAYEQQGQMQASFDTLQRLLQQFPDNDYLAEIHFRIGELEFNQDNYAQAISAYSKVLLQGEQNPYYGTAAYMLGWSYFKNEQQGEALKAFTTLLDHKLPNDIVAQSMLSQVDSQGQIEQLPVGEKRLVTDTIRIMSLLFSYQDSQLAYQSNQEANPAQSIAAHFAQVNSRHYEYVLYDALAQNYLNQDRYHDSAKAYQAFTERHGEHFQAPIFAVKQIDAYILGKFPTLVLPAKQHFVTRYGIAGQYWPNWPIVLQEQVAPFLKEYLQELAQYEHSLGQMLASASQIATPTPNTLDKDTATPEELKTQATQAFLLASKWYQQFILTFPKDPQAPEATYSLGESLFEAQQYSDSIKAFEDYAYQHLQPNTHITAMHPKAAEAAYAAILAYQKIQLDTELKQDNGLDNSWLDKQLIAQENFVATFADDPRASDILYSSMQQLFTLKRYDAAMISAQTLLVWQPKVDADKTLASYLVIGHSQFALQQYSLSESTYEKITQLLPVNDPRRLDIRDRLAASIYKQGELNVKNNYLPLAVNDFLRVLAKTPESAIRVNAQYDAATYLLQMQEWQQGIELFVDFRRRFPTNTLTENIQQQLILAYQQNENWQLAADELLLLHQANPESEEARQALYVAAQYLHKIGNRGQALDAYRTYAHSYATPFAEANEARFIMSEFYLASNEHSKRRFWLNKLIQADLQAQKSADIQRDDRTRYLAALASNVFADDKLSAYKKIKLTQPLKASLAKKKAALTAALDAYNKTLSYKVEEFSTSANFSIADIYHQLAKDLMASSKPKNLNALELEQYDLLLEEQAYPFEEKAIDIHETNAKRSWQGSYDEWVQKSFSALEKLLPGRYNKQEKSAEFTDEIY
ncbi:tetratricopeptide repeat protein [uncultured Paraglaciecola sp.]|uniref:tetratricopeptide repeat protein n=1 Tax=uncultured Paraglaciecola sp. TaxID=1765024 RepID=UPI0030DBA1C0|tara:strand:- start:100506 stop:103556 length:3051 start_codon:yes stop_codon:yes gene_type:complete